MGTADRVVTPHTAAQRRTRQLGESVARLAATQHGVFAVEQLGAIGVTRHELAALGWVRRLHRGVYVVGRSPITVHGRWMAAVLAVGPDAVLFGRSACAALGMAADDPRAVHLACPRTLRRRPGLRLHRVELGPHEIGEVEDIPCSEPNRAIADFAATATRRELEQALDAAAYARTLSLPALEAYAGARRRGSRALAEALASHRPGTTATHSEMEERFLALCDRYGLPRPECNVPHTLPSGRRIRIDALYRDARLAIELDGRGGHAHHKAFRLDRERDRGLTLQGLRPLRYTYADVTAHAARTAAEVGALVECVVMPRSAA